MPHTTNFEKEYLVYAKLGMDTDRPFIPFLISWNHIEKHSKVILVDVSSIISEWEMFRACNCLSSSALPHCATTTA